MPLKERLFVKETKSVQPSEHRTERVLIVFVLWRAMFLPRASLQQMAFENGGMAVFCADI